MVSFSAEVYKFEQKPNFVPYHFYSKIGKNMGTPTKFNTMSKDTESFQLKLCEVTPNILLANLS